MANEKLPCGHEIDPEILRYHMAFQRIKKANPGKIGSNLLAHFTCRQHDPPQSYEYIPPHEGFWRLRVSKPKKQPEVGSGKVVEEHTEKSLFQKVTGR